MAAKFQDRMLEPWQPVSFEGHIALKANTRYFTPSLYATVDDCVEFGLYVDDNGTLKSIMGGDYVHTTDNRVDYVKRVAAADGTKT